jgi:hypothetical protein
MPVPPTSRAIDQYREAVWASDLPPTQRFVALALSRFMDLDTLASAYPGNAKLARLTGCSVRTVQRALRDLQDAGWIRCHKAGKGSWASLYAGVLGDVRESTGVVTQRRVRGVTESPHPSTTTPRTEGAITAPLRRGSGAPSALDENDLLITRCKGCDAEMSAPVPENGTSIVRAECEPCGYVVLLHPGASGC